MVAILSGVLSELQTTFLYPQGSNQNDAGDVRVTWDVAGRASSHVTQFNVTYHCEKDGQTHKKVLSGDQHSATIPLTQQK